MKKKSLLFIVLLIFIKINAQNNIYQPTWESLDTRPTPAWFKSKHSASCVFLSKL